MLLKISKTIIAIFAIIVGLYPAIYFFIDRRFGLLASKSEALLSNEAWNVGFYTHIILGGLALLIGWLQFNPKLRYHPIHRKIGMIYVVAALLSALGGIGIGFYATGGFVAAAGFIGLGIVWFATTLLAYVKIKNREVAEHQKWMIYSYAACLAAVTLRIWLPILTIALNDSNLAYLIVAWLCWIPNLIVARIVIRKLPYKLV